jgi:hypothetical protein
MQFYTESLYPLQDGVLRTVRDLKLPFYLTGGTALSRHFLHHRFSDDLVLFVNDDERFSSYVEQLVALLTDKRTARPLQIIPDATISAPAYARLFLAGYGTQLKVDLVNDIAAHFGEFQIVEPLGKLDSWKNILSNKISALFRFTEKDYVDVWAISKKYAFDWKEIVSEAKQKEAAVDAGEIANVFLSFPFETLEVIRWAEGFDYSTIKEDFKTIAGDIFYGRINSLR